MAAPAVPDDDGEADEGHRKRPVHAREVEHFALHVHDGCLHGRYHAAPQDRHDEARASKLHVLSEALQSDAVDGGEHERHTSADGHEAPESHTAVDEDDAQKQHVGCQGEDGQQLAGADVFQEIGAYEAAHGKEHEGRDVVMRRRLQGLGFGQALQVVEDVLAVIHDVGPAHRLRAHIEELGDDSLAVVSDGENFAQRRSEPLAAARVAALRHLREIDGDEQHDDDQSDVDIGLYEDGEVVGLHGLELGRVPGHEPAAHLVAGRVEAARDIGQGHESARDGPDGVERLRQVQAPRGRGVAAHAVDIGVATGFKKRQAAGHHEISQQEGGKQSRCLGGYEGQCTDGVEQQSHHHARLERVALDEQGGREGHHEIAQIERHLYEGALELADLEDAGERTDHRVGHVVGEAPYGEAGGYHHEREQETHAVFSQQAVFVVCHVNRCLFLKQCRRGWRSLFPVCRALPGFCKKCESPLFYLQFRPRCHCGWSLLRCKYTVFL